MSGIAFFSQSEIQKIYADAGRSIYDSRAIRKVVEKFVESSYTYTIGIYGIVAEYVDAVVSKPDFNLFTEQGIYDLLQFANVSMRQSDAAAAEFRIKLKASQNTSYQKSLEDANVSANEFMAEFADRAIDESREKDFEKYLVDLSIIILNDPQYMLSQETAEFLIKQATLKESIINMKRDKYCGVIERAIENLARLDNLERSGEKVPVYTRDYILRNDTLGATSERFVTLKRDSIARCLDNEFRINETVFHEDTHVMQHKREKKTNPVSFNDYMMIKEAVLRIKEPDYYWRNYETIYSEIEAREVGAQMTADFIKRIFLPNGIAGQEEEQGLEKHRRQVGEFERKSQKNTAMYERAFYKQDKDGQTRTVNQIFDSTVPQCKIAEYMYWYPALAYEFKRNGTKRTIGEQIVFAGEPENKLNLPVMREIIKRSSIVEQDSTLETLNVAIQYMAQPNRTAEEIDFINGVMADNLPVAIRNFQNKMLAEPNRPEDYEAFTSISKVLASYNRGKQGVASLDVPDEEGVTCIDMLRGVSAEMVARNPNIKRETYKYNVAKKMEPLKGKAKSIYEQLKNVSADFIGKRFAIRVEKHFGKRRKKRDFSDKMGDNKC